MNRKNSSWMRPWDELRADGHELSKNGGDSAAAARRLLPLFELGRSEFQESVCAFLQGVIDSAPDNEDHPEIGEAP